MKHAQALVAFITVLVATICWPSPMIAQTNSVRVVVNGKVLPESAVLVISDTVYVALRPVAQALNADVAANGKAKTVTITTLLRQVVLHLDDPWATLNGQRVKLSAPARLSGSQVVLPLRAVGEAFGATVVYKPQTHTVVVAAAQGSVPGGRPTLPPAASGKTLSGTVTSVNADGNPPTLAIQVGGNNYTITVPPGTTTAFRDVRGSVSGNGVLAQVRPGDALVVALDAQGHLVSMADIFAAVYGTVAAVADQNMVLASGRVITADPSNTAVTIDGQQTTFGSLRSGDQVSVREDPISGLAHDVVAFRPGGLGGSATSTPVPSSQQTTNVRIDSVRDGGGMAYRAGQTIRVSADGTAGAVATFDLGDIIINNPMRETRPGHYEGEFTVTVGTNLIGAPIFVRLSKGGQTATLQAPNAVDIVTTPPTVSDSAPGNGARINTSRPNIFATFLTVGDKGMASDSLRMTLDGRDVTAQSTRTESFISYLPREQLPPGRVLVEVKGTDIAGNPLDYRWSFEIAGK